MDRYILYIILSFPSFLQVFTKGIVNFLLTPQKLTFSQQNRLFARIIYQMT